MTNKRNTTSDKSHLSQLREKEVFKSISNCTAFRDEIIRDINDAYNSSISNQDKFAKFLSFLSDIGHVISIADDIKFSNLKDTVSYLSGKYDIDEQPSELVRKLIAKEAIIQKNSSINIDDKVIQRIHTTLSSYYNLVFEGITLIKFGVSVVPTAKTQQLTEKSPQDSHNFYNIKLLTKGKKIHVHKFYLQPKQENENEEKGTTITIRFVGIWESVSGLFFHGVRLNALNLKFDEQQSIYYTSDNSFIVLEPDLLFDATEISENYINNHFVVENHFLSKYKKIQTNKYLVLGNLVNYMLDTLIENPSIKEEDFEQITEKAFKNRILSYISLYTTNSTEIYNIVSQAKEQFFNLLKLRNKIDFNNVATEPSFISPIYGLSGRLDVLEFDKKDNNKFNIIELKSGKPASSQLLQIGGKIERSNIPFNYLMQVTCYNLLLDSTYKGRKGTSFILYSQDSVQPLRSASNHREVKQELISARNKLVFKEREFLLNEKNIFSSLKKVNTNEFGLGQKEISDVIFKISQFTELQKAYFLDFTRFIIKESYAQRIGFQVGETNAFSKLWKIDLSNINKAGKTGSGENKFTNIITELVINKNKSDFNNSYIYLESINGRTITSSFRNGDSIIFIPNESNGNKIYHYILLKSYIKEIGKNHLIISLRNKMTGEDFFDEYKYWNILPDFSDSINKRLHQSLFNFISNGSFAKFNGQLPDDNLIDDEHINEQDIVQSTQHYTLLSEKQLLLLQKAILAKDLFLVQGPPGSGKTSYFIKHLLRYYFEQTDSTILITSFTNRAIEELCSVLNSLNLDEEYLRIGTKTNESQGKFLVDFCEGKTTGEIITKVKNCRIYIATTSSLITNPELFEIKGKFDIAIVDEASQILESQISVVLSNTKKVILIGDEKQLPAISVQSPDKPNELLTKHLGFSALNNSYFERMVNLLQMKKAEAHYGMLEEQARMHKNIMWFANSLFYDNKLILSEFKKSRFGEIQVNPLTHNSKLHTIFDIIFEKKVVFMDVNSSVLFQKEYTNQLQNLFDFNIEAISLQESESNKSNQNELLITTLLIEKFFRIFSENGVTVNKNTFGVISPFRLQNTAISNSLSLLITENKISTKDNTLPSYQDLITVDTVERYQGSEREVIIFNSVIQVEKQIETIKSTKEFIAENQESQEIDRKLNVALTRSKEIFILIGNKTLLEQIPSYNKFIQLCAEKNSIIDWGNLLTSYEL